MTIIADDAEVHDIGGIMGGEHSGCSETTTDVLIESAYFTPERIGTTGRALGINSDARARFERGVERQHIGRARDQINRLRHALHLLHCRRKSRDMRTKAHDETDEFRKTRQ
jgi:phenylalanyl-tRNA synthetase beta chain